jgi:hypothetical protein
LGAIYSDMTEAEIRRSFISGLETNGYRYEIVGDKIIVTHSGEVYMGLRKYIPSGLEFRNGGDVNLAGVESIPPGVEFNNLGGVFLGKKLKRGMKMWVSQWEGNIEGIDSKRLLNLMIKNGLLSER